MLNNVRYVERSVSENFGDSINDLENTNYWELLEVLNAKKNKQNKKKQSNNQRANAYEFLTHHML